MTSNLNNDNYESYVHFHHNLNIFQNKNLCFSPYLIDNYPLAFNIFLNLKENSLKFIATLTYSNYKLLKTLYLQFYFIIYLLALNDSPLNILLF